jgi:opacity protein-like surface antigen
MGFPQRRTDFVNAAKRSVRRAVGLASGFALLLLCVTGMARAQDIEPIKPRSYAVKAGGFLALDGNLKDQTSDLWWFVGLEYHPNFRHRLLNGDVYFGVDFSFRDSGGKTVFSLPLLAKIVWDLTPSAAHTHIYAGLGGGIYFINTRFIGATTQPGLQVIAGVNVTENIFVEVNYNYVSGFTDERLNGLRVDGLNFSIGHRF